MFVNPITSRREVIVHQGQNPRDFSEDDIEGLRVFGRIFGSESWIAVKFQQEPWYFCSLDDMKKTNNGYKVELEKIKQKGLLFEEFISFS